MERLEIHRKIQGLPRNSAPNRVRNRCWATGKPRGVYRDFGLCRNQLRQRFTMENFLVVKSVGKKFLIQINHILQILDKIFSLFK